MTDDYPFLTETVDGELRTGVAFNPTTGRFYEATPEADAEAPIDVKCPRTGERHQWDSAFDQTIASALAGWLFAQYPAEQWAEKRETYIEAPDGKQEQWEQVWDEIADTPVAE